MSKGICNILLSQNRNYEFEVFSRLDIASKKIDICMSVIDSNQSNCSFKQVIFKHFKWI
jgi:hypothetical protein